ncbi:hypothetical protein BT96DRAFT_912424, partial [Gymnopus androsaceus JB14]
MSRGFFNSRRSDSIFNSSLVRSVSFCASMAVGILVGFVSSRAEDGRSRQDEGDIGERTVLTSDARKEEGG